MRFPFRHSHADLDDEECAVLCMRALIDAGAIRYLERERPAVEKLPVGPEKVRQAAALLRRLRAACLALGTNALSAVTPAGAVEAFARWRVPAPTDPAGNATVITLLVRSHNPLILAGTAKTGDGARTELEALSSVAADLIFEVELIADGQRVDSATALAQLTDPPLHDVAITPRVFCPHCGVPLADIGNALARCFNCAWPLAA